LYSPLNYIGYAVDKVLDINFPEFDVKITYKIPYVKCIPTDHFCLRDYVKHLILDQSEELCRMDLRREPDNVADRKIEGDGPDMVSYVYYKFPNICVKTTKFTSDEIQQEILRLLDLCDEIGWNDIK
jgi:hypothetical protein